MPVVIEEYDGLKSHASILMDKLYSWVSSLDISKALEKDRYIKNVASVACMYILKDEKLFTATEQIRGANPKPSSSKTVLLASFPAARIGFTNEVFQFKGSVFASTPLVARGLFDPKPALRKPTIIREDAILEETNSKTLALVSVDKGKLKQI
ncbi:hypothetical protein ACLB2K_066133 [Fragaria x ananassa]